MWLGEEGIVVMYKVPDSSIISVLETTIDIFAIQAATRCHNVLFRQRKLPYQV